MRQGTIIDIPTVGCLEHMPKRLIACERCREGPCVQLYSVLIDMIVQRNHDALAGDHIVPAVGLVIEDQLPAGTAVQPAIDALQCRFADVLEIAVLFKYPRLYSHADIVSAIPVIRLDVADLVILHLTAAILGIGTIPAAERTAMGPVEAKAIHCSSHPY